MLIDEVFTEEDIIDKEKNTIIEKKMIMPDLTKYFNGAAVFYVDKKGFMLKGKVDHSDSDNNSYRYNADAVKRSLYIENILYTLSDKYLKMNDLSDVEEVNSLEL